MENRHGDPSPDYFRLTVDGVGFSVAYDLSQPGAYHYTVAATTVNGPAVDYGFTSRRSDSGRNTMAEHVEAIGRFLSAVDPVTGYIEDDEDG